MNSTGADILMNTRVTEWGRVEGSYQEALVRPRKPFKKVVLEPGETVGLASGFYSACLYDRPQGQVDGPGQKLMLGFEVEGHAQLVGPAVFYEGSPASRVSYYGPSIVIATVAPLPVVAVFAMVVGLLGRPLSGLDITLFCVTGVIASWVSVAYVATTETWTEHRTNSEGSAIRRFIKRIGRLFS